MPYRSNTSRTPTRFYIESRADRIAETRDLDENTLLELHDQGRVCAMTMEHASQRTDISKFSSERIGDKRSDRVSR